MRTLDDVKARLEETKKDFEEHVMVQTAGGFHPLMVFVPECYKEGFEHECPEITHENVVKEMKEYIDFAYKKAETERGISASRTMWKFGHWLWILEDDEIDCHNYTCYGIPQLNAISEKYGLTRAVV